MTDYSCGNRASIGRIKKDKVGLQADPMADPPCTLTEIQKRGTNERPIIKNKNKNKRRLIHVRSHLKSSENTYPRKITKPQDKGVQEDGKCDGKF